MKDKAEAMSLGRVVSCTRCIYDATIPAIVFDSAGVCNYCGMIDQLREEYGTGSPHGQALFGQLLADIRKAGQGKRYDVAIGVSGGTDSSYLMHMAIRHWGLRPLAVHYDNTWNSAIATENIRKVLSKLNVDLFTHVVDNQESDDMFGAFLRAGVPELDGPTDIAAPEVMYRACWKHGIRYVMEGHSFETEGVSPLGNMYIDGRYVKSVHEQFGLVKHVKSFPNMPLWRFLFWVMVARIRKIRPLWYLSYSKEHAREILAAEYGWQYYGGHHLENRLSAFHHSYYNPYKFGLDQRNNSLSAAVRAGRMTRDEALAEFATEPVLENELLEYFLKRMRLTKEALDVIMGSPPRSYRDFKTYKRSFETLRPLFYLLYRRSLVPKSFYLKYTSKAEM